MANDTAEADPRFDLSIRRSIAAPAAAIWKAWTDPEQLKNWWCPKPWTTSDCKIDLRPGGIFRTVLRSPEGKETAYDGCYLEIVPNRKLVYTFALAPGYRPAPEMKYVPVFTGVLMLVEHNGRTDYTVTAMHRDEAGAMKHAEMGFDEGWGTCADQMIALVTGAPGRSA